MPHQDVPQFRPDAHEHTPSAKEPRTTSTLIRDMDAQCRPRERVEALGADAVDDEVLLAVLLRTGRRGASVLEVAREVLSRARDGLPELAAMDLEELRKIAGLGRVKALELQVAFELGRRACQRQRARRADMARADYAAHVLSPYLGHLDVEQFFVCPLDQKCHLIGEPVNVSRGSANASVVHPREVFRTAIRAGAVHLIVAHNHPSGDPAPSKEDLALTRRLVETGTIVGIALLDHLIIGGGGGDTPSFVSLRRLRPDLWS